MEKTLEIHLKEQREQIAKAIEDLLDPPPIDETDHIIWKVVEKCASVARGEPNGDTKDS